MLTNGLDGPMTMQLRARRSRRAPRRSGGRRRCRPGGRRSRSAPGGAGRSSPGTRARPASVSRRRAQAVVGGRAGSGRRCPGPPPWRRSHRSGSRPSRRRRVRCACVARSASPTVNHVGSPRRSNIACALSVSPRMPQPRSASTRPGQRVEQRVDVGADVEPVDLDVVADVGDDRELDRPAERARSRAPASSRRCRRRGG